MRYSFNDGWKFLEAGVDSTLSEVKERLGDFKSVQIPHDWLIYDSEDLYRNGRGWYERDLTIHDRKGKYFLEFDGIYMDSAVYVNDEKVCEWKNGYSAFECDITNQIREGLNRIFVSVTHIAPNSRWYSGAGIYRNVCIRNTDETYIAKDGVYVSSREENGRRIIKIESEIKGRNAQNAVMTHIIKDADGSDCLLKKINDTDYEIENPHIWDIDDPYLYTLKAVMTAGEDTDEVTLRFGIRDIIFDPDKGFLLNARKVKLNGVCEHHDLGALGAAFNKCAMKRKFEILKTMGVNALRTSHNMPAPEVLDLADEMGILVMSEGFDMWYMSKTDYDYSRFFADWHEKDIESWIKQDRNHPSVIMWSIGNEILDCHADVNAPQITEHLADTVKKYDPYGNAHVTFASNYMPWKGAQKCADILKVAGYNYTENLYREHHEEHPDWIIYGSETSSLVQSRGVYHFPLSVIKLSDEDEQCSSLGNCITSWGAKSVENCICDDRDMDFSAGQFLWTGFDYIGEPTPYQTKNSYFGMLDTAGFPKDYYHVFKSAWTDPVKEPFVYIFPYWDFNPGQMIDVRVCSNEDNVELFFNGESLGKQTLTHAPGSGLHIIADYRLPYKEGILEAVAYDKEGNISAKTERKSFTDSASLKLCVNKDSIKAGSDDLIFAEISALDESGNPVENAADRVEVIVKGSGRLVGLDNGDSTDRDSYKGVSRRLFNGKLLAIIAAGSEPGDITISISSKGLKGTSKILKCLPSDEIKEASPFDEGAERYFEENTSRKICLGKADEIPVRKLEIIAPERNLTADKREVKAKVKIYPENATDKNITFEAVSDKGFPVKIAELIPGGDEVTIKAVADGDFRLRCTSKSGSDKVRIISELEFNIKGIGVALLDPYDFIYGSAYTYSEGKISTGNEMGFSTARDERSLVCFKDVDFGEIGSDEITIPIFSLVNEPHTFRIYDGIPSKGGKLIGEFVYQKDVIWNVYQEDTWKFDGPLKGVHDLSFEFTEKVHVKGFSFKK